jgi:hypothetical protein
LRASTGGAGRRDQARPTDDRSRGEQPNDSLAISGPWRAWTATPTLSKASQSVAHERPFHSAGVSSVRGSFPRTVQHVPVSAR